MLQGKLYFKEQTEPRNLVNIENFAPDFPLAHRKVLVVVDVHALEGVPAARLLVLHEEDDAKAALGNDLLEVDRLAAHGPRSPA